MAENNGNGCWGSFAFCCCVNLSTETVSLIRDESRATAWRSVSNLRMNATPRNTRNRRKRDTHLPPRLSWNILGSESRSSPASLSIFALPSENATPTDRRRGYIASSGRLKIAPLREQSSPTCGWNRASVQRLSCLLPTIIPRLSWGIRRMFRSPLTLFHEFEGHWNHEG